MTSSSAHQRILRTAHDLFYRDGIRATGIDKIIREASVTKVTFYRHFPSKHDLIAAFLDYRHERWIQWFERALERKGASAGKGLLAVVAALEEWFKQPEFRGCAFINSVAEMGDCETVTDKSRAHKQDMSDLLYPLLPAGRARRSKALAAAIAIDGAIFQAQLASDKQQINGVLRSLKLLLHSLQE